MSENKEKIKKCSKCKINYPATPKYFHKHRNRNDGFDPWCIECKKKYHKTYYKMKNYEISNQSFERLMLEQDNRCAICGLKFDEIYSTYDYPHQRYDPDIDHDHMTGKVRGLLCLNCNRALGRCNENSLILINAVRYLQRNKPNFKNANRFTKKIL